MNEYFLATSLLIVLALIEGFNGTNFAFRAKHTFRTFKLSYDDGPGIAIQEFGVYSLGLATAYLLAAWEPAWRGGMVLAGIAINVFAGGMHFLRARGIYFGDAQPMLSRRSEGTQGLVHALVVGALIVVLP